MYPSKEREVTLSEDLHGLGRALVLRKPDRIARAAIKHPQVFSCLLQNMCKIVNRACVAVSRPSSRSLFETPRMRRCCPSLSAEQLRIYRHIHLLSGNC